MMPVHWITAQVILVLFLATLVRSALGFGEALIAVPLLAFVVPVEVAAPTAVLVSITVALIIVIQDWHRVHVSSALWLVLPTFLGIPLGLVLLKTLPERIVEVILGVVVAAFALYSLLSRRNHELKNDRLAGFFGFTAITGSPAPRIVRWPSASSSSTTSEGTIRVRSPSSTTSQ